MNKIIKYILVAIVFIAIMAIGILIWQRKTAIPIVQFTPTSVYSPIIRESPVPTPTPELAVSEGILFALGDMRITEEEASFMNIYQNAQFDFSIKIPKNVLGTNDCIDPGSTSKNFMVPLKIFNDVKSNMVFIVPEYYYHADTKWDSVNYTTQVGLCKKIVYSLDLIKKEIAPDPESLIFGPPRTRTGWGIAIKSVVGDTDLDKFIKDNYGSGCFVEKKIPWMQQEGVYEIVIKGEDWDKGVSPEISTCQLPMSVLAVLYDSKIGKVMSANLGQEPTFYTDSTNIRVYDKEMIKSFRFE